MISRLISKSLYLILFLALLPNKSIAYDSNKAHPLINEQAAELSINMDNVLLKAGFESGINSVVNTKKISEWFRMGGIEEDSWLRFLKHFHDPTKSWSQSGLKNSFLGMSSLLWAQDQSNTWSWQSAREFYYQALTSNQKTMREKSFADACRSLGQVMHLLSDASVPEHTRDDMHVFPFFANPDQSFPQIGSWTYETWCKYNSLNLNINAAAQNYGITNTTVVPDTIPISNFWDTTPSPLSGSYTPVGLAEYTNYNFLSSDTIFKDYAYPQISNYFIESAVAEDGVADNIIYFQGTTSDNKVINHLAATGYFWSDLSDMSTYISDDTRFKLDDNCFKDYADILVPKAVSFSTGLLDYFFRGQIDMVPADTSGTGYQIVNNSEEDMNGTFELWYDNKSGQRLKAWNGALSLGKQSTGNNKSHNITFNYPTDTKDPGKYILVFRGKLGNEPDAVVFNNIRLSSYGIFGCFPNSKNAYFNIPPLGENGGSFTIDGYGFDLNGTFYFVMDGSYGSGHMSVDITSYVDWWGYWEFGRLDRCEGSWDGHSFYAVCKLINDRYADCIPTYLTFSMPGSIASNSSAVMALSQDPSDDLNSNCSMLRK